MSELNPSLARVYSTARPVWVDVETRSQYAFVGDPRSEQPIPDAVRLTGREPGWLDAWIRTEQGYWVGLVRYQITQTPGAMGPLTLRTLETRRVLRPRAAEVDGYTPPF